MPDPGEVRDGLVWTGTNWVPLKPASEAAPRESRASREAAQNSNARGDGGPAQCPECGKDDRVSRLSGFIDRSTHTTQGKANTLAVGVSTGGVGAGAGRTKFEATTESRLVERLKPPPLRGDTRWVPLLIGFGLLFPAALLLSGDGTKSAGAIVLSVLLLVSGCVVLLPAAIEMWLPSVSQRETWQQGLGALRGAFYCERDDVAFLPGSSSAMPVEELVTEVFKPYEQAPPRRLTPW